MQYRYLGHTEIKVSTLSLGTVALGMNYGISPDSAGMKPPADVESIRLVHRAIDEGINFIDTARAYGRSEEVLGQALKDRRSSVVIATKTGCYDSDGNLLHGKALRQHMEDSITTSLKLLQTDFVDLLMLHSAPMDLLQAGEAITILKDLKQRGLARSIGASTYGVDSPLMAIEMGVDALQVAYNILDQRMADDVLPAAYANGVGIIVRSVYLKGVLTPRAADLPDHLSELKQRSDAIRSLADSLNPPLPLVEAALRFVLSQSNITSALVGVHSEQELEAALIAARAKPLSPEVLVQFESHRWDDPQMLNPATWGLP